MSNSDICNCQCHNDPKVVHRFACCEDCEICGEHIKFGAYERHLEECKARLAAMPEIDPALLEAKSDETP